MTERERIKAAFVAGFTKEALLLPADAQPTRADMEGQWADFIRPARMRLGAAYGAPIGAGLGGLYGGLTNRDSGTKDRVLRALKYALLGGAVGGGAGAALAPMTGPTLADLEQELSGRYGGRDVTVTGLSPRSRGRLAVAGEGR